MNAVAAYCDTAIPYDAEFVVYSCWKSPEETIVFRGVLHCRSFADEEVLGRALLATFRRYPALSTQVNRIPNTGVRC